MRSAICSYEREAGEESVMVVLFSKPAAGRWCVRTGAYATESLDDGCDRPTPVGVALHPCQSPGRVVMACALTESGDRLNEVDALNKTLTAALPRKR